MNCKICSSQATPVLKKKVLNKYDVSYFNCNRCGFIQTEEPYWLKESYQSAITSLDIGLIFRNIYLNQVVQSLIVRYFNTNSRFLDFGGGYGMFVRMMRDKGFDFYRQDKFCDNLFSRNFDIEDLKEKSDFELVTAFEVFEHLEDPIQGIEEMMGYSNTIIFSTELSPDKNLSSWWYLVPEVGQHISLYQLKTLKYISEKFKLNLYSNNHNFHMLSSKKINPWIFKQLTRPKISFIYATLFSQKDSLLHKDFEFLKRKLFDHSQKS